MTTDSLSPVILVLCFTALPLALLIVAILRLRQRSRLSRAGIVAWSSIGFVSLLPLLGINYLVVWFAITNFPFTSGVIAHASSPNGEEACIVQTFKGAEPYQVSLYARRSAQPWVWHYLAHQDSRWRHCRLEFADGQLHIYTGATLRKTFPLVEAMTIADDPRDQLPATYTPEQILAQHNAYFRH